jgi:hypothetical protein
MIIKREKDNLELSKCELVKYRFIKAWGYGERMSKVKEIKTCLIGVLAIVSVTFSLSASYAAYNGAILSEIEITPYHDSSYEITIRTDREIPVEKHIVSNNEIVLELKNTRPAEFVNTIYNNATRINHVIIQPASSNRVKILLQGANIIASRIALDTDAKQAAPRIQEKVAINLAGPDVANNEVSEDTTAEQSQELNLEEPIEESKTNVVQEITLKQPIEKFKPIDTTDITEDSEEAEEDSLGIMQGTMVSDAVKNLFSKSNLDLFLKLFGIIFLIVASIRLFISGNKNVEISLSKNSKKKELELAKIFNNREGLINTGISDNKKIRDIIQKPGYNSVSNYGIKEYQNSQVPPASLYDTSPSMSKIAKTPKLNKPLPSEALLKSLEAQKTSAKVKPSFNTGRITEKDMNTAKGNINSQKFLETMAQIYEKSGREDLAHGIKHNILRNKIS